MGKMVSCRNSYISCRTLKKDFRSAGKNSTLQENIGVLQDFRKAEWYPAGKVSILQVKN